MYPCSIQTLQADALFASALQRSDNLSIIRIRQAIAMALDAYGAAGCAGRVAQEFGDHPETAAVRMRWARSTAAALEGQSDDPADRRRRQLRLGQEADGGAGRYQVGVIRPARSTAMAGDNLYLPVP